MQEDQLRELVTDLSKEFPLPVTTSNHEQLIQHLKDYIDHLISHDFYGLISLLYRVDIPEKKLRDILNEATSIPASSIITSLIIERQLQKIETRKAFKKDTEILDDERW